MGDVAMTIPVLKSFTNTYPEVKLTVVSRAFFKPFFEELPNTSFLEADVYGKHKGVKLLNLAREAKVLEIDAVADLHNVIRSKIIRNYLRLSFIKTAKIDKGRIGKKALTREVNKVFKPLKSTHQRYADVFASLGYPLNINTTDVLHKINFNSTLLQLIGNEPKKLIGIAPFAAHDSKMYPLYLMKEVIKELDKEKEYILLLFGGGNEEVKQLTKLEEEFSTTICVAGKINFKEELTLISNLDLMLSMDSGNGHLAAMYGVPVISLWGVTHPYAGFVPFGQNSDNSLVANRDKYPLIPTSIYGNKYPDGYKDAIKTIAPNDVVLKIKEII